MRRREKARKGERERENRERRGQERERAKERDRERHLKQGYVYGGDVGSPQNGDSIKLLSFVLAEH